MIDSQKDKLDAATWAYNMTHRKTWCILDCETTGLTDKDQICQVAIVDPDGQPLFESLVRPTVPISPGAAQVNGLTDDVVADAPSFSDIFPQVWKAIGQNDLVIYNARFDLRLIVQSLLAHGLPLVLPSTWGAEHELRWITGAQVHCAMHWFSQWCGQLNFKGGYKWQKLPGGDHTAVGDCVATLDVIKRMAESYEMLKAETEGYVTAKPVSLEEV